MSNQQPQSDADSCISGIVSARTWTPGGAVMMDVPAGVGDLKSQISNKEMSLGQTAGEWLAAWGEGITRSYDGPRRPASESVWPYACISAIVGAVGSVPLAASRGPATGTHALWNLPHVRAGSRAARRMATKSQIPLLKNHKSQKAVEGEIVEAGPLHDLLASPMPGLTQRDWVERIVGYLYVCGRVHILKAGLVGTRPTMLVPIPGSSTKPLYQKGDQYKRIIGWEVTGPDGDSYPIPAELLVTLTLFNAYDPDVGLAPHNPARLSIAADYNASTHVAASFANGCEPGGILKVDGPYSAEVDHQMRRAWQQRHQGAANARKLAILFGNADYKTIAQSMMDMGLDTVKQRSREETCAIYRVPASVAGFFGTSGDASAYVKAEQQRFWQDTAGMLAEKLATAINIGIAPLVEGGLEVWADLEDVPVYQAMRQANMKAVGELWSKGVPLADLSDMLDLGVPDRPQHRIGYLPAGLIPAEAIAEPPDAGETPPPEGSDSVGQGRSADFADPRRLKETEHLRISAQSADKSPSAYDVLAASLWKAWAASWRPLARGMENMLRSHLMGQQRKVVAGLKNADITVAGSQEPVAGEKRGLASTPATGYRLQATKNPDVVARVLFAVFGSPQAAQVLQARVRVFMADARELGVRQALAEAGVAGDELDAAIRQMTTDPEITEALLADQVRVSTLVNNRTRDLLRRELLDGLDAGEGIRELTSRVQGVMQNRRAQAHLIARNTVAQANSHARYVGRATYATHEIWVSSRGPGERRQSHLAAEARYRKQPKPIGERWVVGAASLRYPRDPAGPPGEVINCQCVAIGKRLYPQGRSADCAEPGRLKEAEHLRTSAQSADKSPSAINPIQIMAAQVSEGFVGCQAVTGLLRNDSASAKSAKSADESPGEPNG